MQRPQLLLAAIAAATLIVSVPACAAEPMTVNDYFALDGPAPSEHIVYGPAPSQFVELFEPTGKGPFPVVAIVHGGCWSKELGGIHEMRNMAGALVAQRIAVWNVEYRRIDEEGGGYPGTYQDINRAFDLLLSKAGEYELDTTRIIAVGHSAGGHLVQWLAGRTNVPKSSPVYDSRPLHLVEVISFGGLADLKEQKARIKSTCGVDVESLTGTPSAARPDPYRDTSAAALIPNGSHTILINGALDNISPPDVATAYAELANHAGDRAETVVLANASHFDEVAATSPAWNVTLPLILSALHHDK